MIDRLKILLGMLIVALALLAGAMVGATFMIIAQTAEEATRTEEQVEYVAKLEVIGTHSLYWGEKWKALALRAVQAQYGPTYSDSVILPSLETDATEIE